MVIRKRTIEGKAGRYYEGKAESYLTDDKTGQSHSETYTVGGIEKKTMVVKSKEKKDDFIYRYNLKLHGRKANPLDENTSSTEWVEKA